MAHQHLGDNINIDYWVDGGLPFLEISGGRRLMAAVFSVGAPATRALAGSSIAAASAGEGPLAVYQCRTRPPLCADCSWPCSCFSRAAIPSRRSRPSIACAVKSSAVRGARLLVVPNLRLQLFFVDAV